MFSAIKNFELTQMLATANRLHKMSIINVINYTNP